jgi:hypothetical protein
VFCYQVIVLGMPCRAACFGKLPEFRFARSKASRPRERVTHYFSVFCDLSAQQSTAAECLEHARQCEWYAVDEEDRKFLLQKAKDWRKLAIKKELEIRAAARVAA